MESAPSAHRGGVELPRSARCRPVNGQTLGTGATPPTILACSQSPRSPLPLSFLSFADYKNMVFFFFAKKRKAASVFKNVSVVRDASGEDSSGFKRLKTPDSRRRDKNSGAAGG